MNSLTIQIKGATWTVKKLTPRKFNKEHKSSWAAVTLPDSREIHLNGNSFAPSHVRHELLHAFYSEGNTESTTQLTEDDVEEICASIVGEYAIEIVRLADIVLTFFLKKDR